MPDSTPAVTLPAPPAKPIKPAVAPVPQDSAVEKLYGELEAQFAAQRPGEELATLRRAFEFAQERHGAQKRATGEPFMVHPLLVARQLADMHMDMTCIVTGLLHDVVEDTAATVADVKRAFGDDVARCVDGVTKLSKLNLASREERQAESVRKMLLAMVNDIRVILVKLADRLHNMRTLGSLPREKQERIAAETMEIYAPIAHRLGMGKIRGELEDLSFRYLEPEASAELMREFDATRTSNEAFLKEVRGTVEVLLAREGIPARVEGRLKRPYSVFQKLKRQKIGIEQVYDILAVRIVTDSVKNCYAALGVIHNEWHPIPGRIKDFIAIPRPNLYQSLHTSVMGPGGRHFEVQIRTDEMHRVAEEGIAAHWKYKEGRRGPGEDDRRVAWLRQLVEWQREMRDPAEFMSTLKVDLYPEEVYTFTPKGRVIILPRDATPIDFAYAIHSDVGNTCTGAKVNGRIVQLKYALRNGDVVEIITTAGHLPSKDWLSLVKTSRARNKIKHVINTTERAKAIEIGEKHLQREARRLGVALSRIPKARFEEVAADYGCSKIEDLHAALGYGKFSPRQVLQKLAPDQVPAEAPPQAPEITPHASGCRAGYRRQGAGRRPEGAWCGRFAGVPCQVLQPDSRRGHRRLRDARERRRRSLPYLFQRAEPDVRSGAQDRRRMGACHGRDVSCQTGRPQRGPARDSESAHHDPVQRTNEYPQPGGALRRRTRRRWSRDRHHRRCARQEAVGACGFRVPAHPGRPRYRTSESFLRTD